VAKLRGNVFYNFTNAVMDSRNPFASVKAPLQNNAAGGNLSGPLGKRVSYTVDAQQNYVYNGSVVNAVILSPLALAPSLFNSVIKTRQQRTRVTPRVDYRLNDNNTLTIRYALTQSDIRDAGIGGFDLISRGYHFENTNQTMQVTETAILGPAVNETRFQYFRSAYQITPNDTAPEISVLGSFNEGGAQTGLASDVQNNFELQNYTILTRGSHTWNFGIRIRQQTEDNISPANFGGTFTFGSIEQYVLQEPSQFSINTGNPAIAGHQADAGAFVGDDWRVLPNFTINLGLRYEAQTNIHDKGDFAPRVAFAWAPGGRRNSHPRIVLRGGLGMFYDRFALLNTLTAERFNGITEQQYVISNPDFFPAVPPVASLTGLQSPHVIQEVDSHLRAPYLMQSAFTVERQLLQHTTVAVTYSNSHGLRELRSLDINAPLPGTYNPAVPGSGVFPDGTPNPIFLMTSSGLYNQNQMFVNVNSRI
jgi:hypothetical protein